MAVRNVEMELTVTIMTDHVRVVIIVTLGLRKGRAPQSKIAFVPKKTAKMVITWIVRLTAAKKIPQTKTSTESTVSSINKPITLKSLLSKRGTPKPTVSIKPAGTGGTVEPVGRNATYSNISTKAVSQPMNSTPDNRLNCAAIIGGSLVGALLVIGLITFISVKFNLCRILCCIGREREGLEKGKSTSVKTDYCFPSLLLVR